LFHETLEISQTDAYKNSSSLTTKKLKWIVEGENELSMEEFENVQNQIE